MDGDPISPIGRTHAQVIDETEQADDAYRQERAHPHLSEAIAREVIRLRMETGWSQAELARRVGTTGSVISRIERGDHMPSTETVRRIADATGRTVVIHFVRRRSHRRPAAVPAGVEAPAATGLDEVAVGS